MLFSPALIIPQYKIL